MFKVQKSKPDAVSEELVRGRGRGGGEKAKKKQHDIVRIGKGHKTL